jgi:hypothetical protein
MSEVIANTDLPREAGYLYFCGTDDKGNLTICKATKGKKKIEE